MDDLVTVASPDRSSIGDVHRGDVDRLASAAWSFLHAAQAPTTRRNYAADWRAWSAWALDRGLPILPAHPIDVANHLADFAAHHKATTVARRAVAIGKAHRLAGHHSPTDAEPVRLVLAGIRRTLGMAAAGKAPLATADIERLIVACPTTLAGDRDRALLLVGYMGAFRRSELAALDVEDLHHHPQGLLIRIRRSKTDQDGHGRHKTLVFAERHRLCPVGAVNSWLTQAGFAQGPLFRSVDRHGRLGDRLSDRAVAETIKRAVARAGLDPRNYGAHSLRAGHVTEAKRRDAPDLAVLAQTHHRRADSLIGYVREADPFRHTSARWLGL